MSGDLIEIELKNYEKYRPRADIKEPWWFKMNNKLFEDDALFDFSLKEMAVWTYVLCIAGQQSSNPIRISISKAKSRIPKKLLLETIEKLAQLGIVTLVTSPSVHDPAAIRTDHVHDPAAIRAQKEEKRMRRPERREESEPLPPLDFLEEGKVGSSIADITSSPDILFATSKIPEVMQRAWVATYDKTWLLTSLARAIAHSMQRQGVTDVHLIGDWPKRLSSWFAEERKPKLKPRAPPPKQKPEEKPFDPAARTRALEDPEVAAARNRLLGVAR